MTSSAHAILGPVLLSSAEPQQQTVLSDAKSVIPSHDQKNEEQAANQLRSRPGHLSKDPVNKLEAENARKQIAITNKWCPVRRFNGSTSEVIYWEPEFVFLKAFNIAAKDSKAGLSPRLINVYYSDGKSINVGNGETGCEFFLCYIDKIASVAKLQIRLGREVIYPDNRIGCLLIAAINNVYDREYRHGALLIQIAVEYSLRLRFGGRIILRSNGNSDEFYSKMGFLKKDGFMYLPESVIAVWEEKITQYPVLSAQEQPFALTHAVSQVNEKKASGEDEAKSSSIAKLSFMAQPQLSSHAQQRSLLDRLTTCVIM